MLVPASGQPGARLRHASGSRTSEIHRRSGDFADGDFVILGPLKGNSGDQNYPLPSDLDLTRFRSAAVWCNRFSVGFGAAPLGAP